MSSVLLGHLRGADGVAQEHRDGHRADAAGVGGDGSGDLADCLKIDIADEAIAVFRGRIVDAVHANIDDDRARLDHVGLDEERLAHGGDNDVGASAMVGDILAARVEDGDGGVGMFVLLYEDRGHGLAHDVAATEDDDFSAAEGNLATNKEFMDAGGRAGLEKGILTEEELADIDGVEAVDVLAVIDGAENFVFLEVARERGLDEDSVDLGIVVEAVDEGEKLGLGCFFLQHNGVGVDAEFGRLGAFHADVGLRGGIFTNADESDAGRDAPLLAQGGNAGFGLGVNLGGDGFAIDESCAGHREQSKPSGVVAQVWSCLGDQIHFSETRANFSFSLRRMLFLRAGILEFLVLVHVIGAAVLFRRLFPRESPWLAFIVPTLLVVAAANFIEHFVALPNIGWVLPFTLGGLIWLMAQPGPWWKDLRLPAILFATIFTWALFIRCLNPAITSDNESAADMARMLDFCLGGTLPAIYSWCPPYEHGGISSFQYYGASVLKRLFWLDIGSSYNVGYTLLNALTCLMGAGAAYAISGKKTWVAVATVVMLLANFTGSAVILLYWNNAHPISGLYHIFDSPLSVDIGAGWNDPERHNPFAWIYRNPPAELRLYGPAFYTYYAEFSANLGGQFLTLASLLVVNEVFKTERANWPWICLMLFPLLTIITATGFMIVVTVLCVGGFATALWAEKRPGDWRMVAGGGALGFVLLWPSIDSFAAGAPPVEFHWTPWLEYTTPWEFVIQWWPVIVPWAVLCFIWRRLGPLARWIHAAVPLLLIFFEVTTFGDRGRTAESNWGAIYGIGLVTFLPLVFIQKNSGFRLLSIIYLFIGVVFVGTWGILEITSVSDGAAFHLKGDSVFQNDAQMKRLLEVLNQMHGKTVLNGKSKGGNNQSLNIVGFSENRCYIGWFDPEVRSGHGGEAQFRSQQSDEFFAGTGANPLAFLRSNDIAAVMIWPEDAIPDDLVQKLKDQLALDYDYVDCKGDGPNNAGLFLRNPGTPGMPTIFPSGSSPMPATPSTPASAPGSAPLPP
jgi:hypothetical protein